MAEQNQRAFVPADAAEFLSRIIRARRRRAAFFSHAIFADPAWDILLHLFLAELLQRPVQSGELMLSSAVPEHVARRWTAKLEQDGWVRRKPDRFNPGLVLVELSGQGSRAMQAWLDDWIEQRSNRSAEDRVRQLLERIERSRRGS